MYIALVLLQTVLLPIASGSIALAINHGDPITTYGVWFLFWGVGTRLLVAGLVQIFRPGFTIQNILGAPNAGATQVAQELGFANLSIGAGAIATAFFGDWESRRPSSAGCSSASPASGTCRNGIPMPTRQ